VLTGAAEVLVAVPVPVVACVVFRCEDTVTVPLMILSVTIPPPPTRRVTVLVEPRDALEVVVVPGDELLPVPAEEPEPVLEADVDDADLLLYRSLAVI